VASKGVTYLPRIVSWLKRWNWDTPPHEDARTQITHCSREIFKKKENSVRTEIWPNEKPMLPTTVIRSKSRSSPINIRLYHRHIELVKICKERLYILCSSTGRMQYTYLTKNIQSISCTPFKGHTGTKCKFSFLYRKWEHPAVSPSLSSSRQSR